jgi:hypothetical protein
MKASKQKPAASWRTGDYTAAQTSRMFDDLERRDRNFVELWRSCPDRHCRRSRQCLGCPKFPCTGGRMMGRRTKRQNLRLVRDFLRSPPPGFGTEAD